MKIKNHFETKDEALKYKAERQIYNMVPEYLTCVKKWALVFPIKTIHQKESESKLNKQIEND